LLDAGITRVVIGTTDPNLEASGGTDYLRSNGIEVEIVNDEICKNLIAPYTHRLQTGLPWITCKWAQTSDGCIETAENESPWISCKESQIFVHKERSCVDAIVVGIGTVIADNPTLTVRNTPKRRTPLRVVIDPTLRIPSDANILNDDAPTLIAHIETADTSSFSSNQLLALPSNNGVLNLSPLFRHLVTEYNATHVIVEGGSTLFQHLFEQELVNELLVFTSPNSSTIVPKLNMNELVKHIPKQTILTNQCGVDCVTRYRITW
jgi:diaminohydroxyphosphoribosylaminopyrimidine deaminase/5-amino-6-(5-phosphoribosylamino)uracil reductase